MKLAELSDKAGGISNSAVTLAVQRLQAKGRRHRDVSRAMKTITRQYEL
jgi:DNA-binding HxlR family transcriptional regulator